MSKVRASLIMRPGLCFLYALISPDLGCLFSRANDGPYHALADSLIRTAKGLSFVLYFMVWSKSIKSISSAVLRPDPGGS